MASISGNVYRLGIQIGFARAFASLNNPLAQASLQYALASAKELQDGGLLQPDSYNKLFHMQENVSTPLHEKGGLHENLVEVSESFTLMRDPYDILFRFGLFLGIAEVEASAGSQGDRIRVDAINKAKDLATQLKAKNYDIDLTLINVKASLENLRGLRENLDQAMNQHI